MVARQQRVDDLRQDRVLVAHDSREERAAVGEPGQQVGPDLVSDGPPAERRGDIA